MVPMCVLMGIGEGNTYQVHTVIWIEGAGAEGSNSFYKWKSTMTFAVPWSEQAMVSGHQPARLEQIAAAEQSRQKMCMEELSVSNL